MSSTKIWSKYNTSNKITSHGEVPVETEYGLHNKYCSMRVSDKVWWVMAWSHIQELEKYFNIYGPPCFHRVMIITLSTQGRLFCICRCVQRAGKPCWHCYHITDAIESTYYELIWWDSFHYFGNDIEYKITAAGIINSKNLGILYTPNVKRITQPVHTYCEESFLFEWIMQSPIPILVTYTLPVRKCLELSSDDLAYGFEVHFDPNFSEYDLIANRHYKEMKYSQELKIVNFSCF
jgi:hypothetical protein